MTACPIPAEPLPYRALEQLAPSLAGLMDACHVAEFTLQDGRVITLVNNSAKAQEK